MSGNPYLTKMEHSRTNTGEGSLILIGCNEEEIAEGVSILHILFSRHITLLDNEHHRNAIEMQNPTKPSERFTPHNLTDSPKTLLPPTISTSTPLFVDEPSPLSEETNVLAALLPPPVR